MTAPGWYHAQGDPAGSQRYWNGTQWQGEPSLATSGDDIVYYAPAETEVDLGDVATRVSLRETDPSTSYTMSPYSVTTSTVNVARRGPLPEGLKNLTVLVSVLKAIPLILMTMSVVSLLGRSALGGRTGGRYAPPGLDFNAAFATAIVVMIAIIAMGATLTFIQIRSALRDHAANLFAIALILLLLDLLNAANQWFRFGQGFSAGASMLATVAFILQALLTVWAGIHARKA